MQDRCALPMRGLPSPGKFLHMYRNILVGYDRSDQAEDALALGKLLAEASGASLTVGGVLPDPHPLGQPRGRLSGVGGDIRARTQPGGGIGRRRGPHYPKQLARPRVAQPRRGDGRRARGRRLPSPQQYGARARRHARHQVAARFGDLGVGRPTRLCAQSPGRADGDRGRLRRFTGGADRPPGRNRARARKRRVC